MEEKSRKNLISGNKPLSVRKKGINMGSKKLLNIYKSAGGQKSDPDEKDEPIEYEKVKVNLKVEALTTNVDHNLDGEFDKLQYISVSEYADYINKSETIVFRMIKDGNIQSIKLKNKLHVILD